MLSNKLNFQELLAGLLAKLSDREQEIIKKRYQLTSDVEKRSTLKQIGDFYNITRERVRQIEKDAIRKLVELRDTEKFAGQIKEIEQSLVQFLEQNGGLVKEDQMLATHALSQHDFDYFHPNAYLFVLDNILDSVEKVSDHAGFHPIWKLSSTDLAPVSDLVETVYAAIEKSGELQSEEQILSLAESNLSDELKQSIEIFLQKHSGLELNAVLRNYLEATQKLENNILGEWGLNHWETIRPKKLADKIKLIFSNVNKPLHFRDIAEKINAAGFAKKQICAATVHNELISNENYVLIGRGIYALKNWGYVEGTVAEIIKDILQKSTQPLSKQEIIEAVLKQRQVNKSTIYLTLINKDVFDKLEDGRFSLRA